MLADYKHISKIIEKDKSINFVALARTPWHALGCKAALLKMKAESVRLNGILFLDKDNYKAEKPMISRADFSLLDENDIKYSIFYQDLDNIFSKSKTENVKKKALSFKYFINHQKGSRKIYIFSPFHINDILAYEIKSAVPDSDIVNIVIDEGLGIYMRSDFNWAVEQYQNTHSLKKAVLMFINMQKKKLFNYLSLKRNEFVNNNILVKNKGRFEENKQITEYYRQVIDACRISSDKYSRYENAVVISAQLYFENNQIKNDADLVIYKKIISVLAEKGISVVFKPHPRDKNLNRYNSLGCFVDTDNTVSQEVIIASLNIKPLAVLSFTSTSLVTSKLFYGVKTASLNNLLKKDDVQLTLQNEFSNFEKTFGSIAFMPKNTDELIDFICN